MKSRLNITKWVFRITALCLLIGAGSQYPKFIKYLEPMPPSLESVTICPTDKKCDEWEFNQGQDNVFLHIDTQGDWEDDEVTIRMIYMLGDMDYELLEMTKEINGDEVFVLEKDLKNGWLIGEYFIQVSVVGENSNVIHTTFDIMAGS